MQACKKLGSFFFEMVLALENKDRIYSSIITILWQFLGPSIFISTSHVELACWIGKKKNMRLPKQ
jgi:hypothetical protein